MFSRIKKIFTVNYFSREFREIFLITFLIVCRIISSSYSFFFAYLVYLFWLTAFKHKNSHERTYLHVEIFKKGNVFIFQR